MTISSDFDQPIYLNVLIGSEHDILFKKRLVTTDTIYSGENTVFIQIQVSQFDFYESCTSVSYFMTNQIASVLQNRLQIFQQSDIIEMKHSSTIMDICKRTAPGLNVQGPCHNQNCSAQGSMVTVNLGFGEFDLSRIILNMFVACPLCQKKIEPIRYGFNQCEWRHVDHYSTDAYPLFCAKDEYVSLRLDCVYQVIEVMPLSTVQKDDKRLSIIHTLQDTESENIYEPEPC